jgi:hypothetical protein
MIKRWRTHLRALKVVEAYHRGGSKAATEKVARIAVKHELCGDCLLRLQRKSAEMIAKSL